jgi:hypothetical protein
MLRVLILNVVKRWFMLHATSSDVAVKILAYNRSDGYSTTELFATVLI